MSEPLKKNIFVAITGASGSVYAEHLIHELTLRDDIRKVYVSFSDTAKQVCAHELSMQKFVETKIILSLLRGKTEALSPKIKVFDTNDFFAPIASGSSAPHAMVVTPCSMGTLGRITHGMSTCLLERAADVCLKQKKHLIICPRETPLSSIHLENMLKLSKMGVDILPLMPGFYHPMSELMDVVKFMTAKVMDSLGLTHQIQTKWREDQI